MSIENPDRGTFLPFSRRDLNAPDPSLSISVPRRRSFPVSQMRRPEKTPAVFTPSPSLRDCGSRDDPPSAQIPSCFLAYALSLTNCAISSSRPENFCSGRIMLRKYTSIRFP